MPKRQVLLGRKIGMTQIFNEKGEVVPATVIEAGPCHVTQVKTVDSDGYNGVQLGFEHSKKLNKPERGHLKGELPSLRTLREFRTDDAGEYTVGQVLNVDIFAEGQAVDVIGTSKGRGFAGAMKRHGFSGGPITHGQSDRQRATGSIGSGSTPGRVWKGMRGPGHMGNSRVTVLNLSVVKVDIERHLIAIRGSIPGPNGGLVMIRSAVKTQKK